MSADIVLEFLLVSDFSIHVQILTPDLRKIQIPGVELFPSITADFYWNTTEVNERSVGGHKMRTY